MTPTHYSPSSINSFINYRYQWVEGKICGGSFHNNPSFARGKAVETGIASFLCRGKDEEESVKIAKDDYIRESADLVGDDQAKFTDQIEPMVRAGITHYRQIGPLIAGKPEEQVKINTCLSTSPTPIIGYLDLSWPGEIHDIKTASKTPSKLSTGYIIQGTIYKLATGKDVTFDFIIPLKNEVKMKPIKMSDDEFVYGIKIAEAAARNMDSIMETVPDVMTPEHLKVYKALAFPALDSIWNPAEKSAIVTGLSEYNL